MTQHQAILNHMLRNGGITMREALIDYSIQSLTKRISELKRQGYKILAVRKEHPVTGQKYSRYVLQGRKK